MAAHQQLTRDWWDLALPKFDAFISAIVMEEASKGDIQAAQLRLEKISNFLLLLVTPEVRELSDLYFSAAKIPEKARADSYHLALASWHGMDFLVSWNCKHIANGNVKKIVDEINADYGIRSPIICTPEELLEV